MTGAPKARSRALAGGALWLGFLLLTRPGPFDPAWIHALLLLAPLTLLPLGLDLVERAGAPAGGEGPGGPAPGSSGSPVSSSSRRRPSSRAPTS